jgi:hypothetical protein
LSEFLKHYFEIMSDLPHLAAESTFILIEFLIGAVVYKRLLKPAWAKFITRTLIDHEKEHGITHDRPKLTGEQIVRTMADYEE